MIFALAIVRMRAVGAAGDTVLYVYTLYTIEFWVSAHGRLNITSDFGPHGHLPGIKIPYYVCIEAAILTP